jgi:arsenite methyltransferase
MSSCCGSTNISVATNDAEEVREQVRAHYSAAALRVSAGAPAGCCGAEGGCADSISSDPISSDLYGDADGGAVPGRALEASLGCGNPTALAELREGEVVLDLGSGGGIDVLLTARRVGPSGKAYGLDMTDEMLALARANQQEAGITNAEFIKGRIESIPLDDESVDVVISNCVVNLSPEKERVLNESFRVLRPGGRLAISDIVFRVEPSEAIRSAMGLWGSCISGALTEASYRAELAAAGFVDIDIEFTREYSPEMITELAPELASSGPAPEMGAAFVRGRKPAP